MNNRQAQWILRRTAWGLWGGVGFAALVLLTRGLSGAFTQELSSLAACCGATIAAANGLLAFVSDHFAVGRSFSRKRIWQSGLLTILPPAVLGLTLMPSSSSLGIAWLTVLTISSTMAVMLVVQPNRTETEGNETSEEPLTSIPIEPHADAMQWMTRRLLNEAGETWDQMEGGTTVEFAAGQKHATIHLTICPPFAQTPEIECEVLGETEVEWKAAAVHPYGVRLELRRPKGTDEAASIPLGYTMAAPMRMEIENAA